MNQINKQKLSAVKTIKYNGNSCLELKDLQQALYSFFNSAQFQSIDELILNKCKSFSPMEWLNFLKEFSHTITNCSNLSVPGPDKMSQGHLKCIIKDKFYLKNIVYIANTCLELDHWPNHFKKSIMIVIPKPNKSFYNSLKSFRPIVLLNTLGKLIKKVIRERLQFQAILNNFIHQS